MRISEMREALDWIQDQRILDSKWWRIEGSYSNPPELHIPASNVDELREIMRALGGPWQKDIGDWYAYIVRMEGTLKIEVSISRDAVCEAVVVGEKAVEIPDPDAPRIRVMRPKIEWRCSPLLEDHD
jgi:hypothetical protein